MTDSTAPMSPTRTVCYADGQDLDTSRDFYTGVLGMNVAMDDPVLGLVSPVNGSAQVLIPPPGFEQPAPRFGIDLGEPAAVTKAHGLALERGLRVVYPLTDEPWGVRRFFVEDPGGTIINVLAHTIQTTSEKAFGTRLLPRLVVPDPDSAADFYHHAVDAEEVFRAPPIDDGRPGVIEQRVGDLSYRVAPAVEEWGWHSPSDLDGSPVLLEIETQDPDVLGNRMTTHGAEVVVPIEHRPYGQRSGRLRDPFGHLWILSGPLTSSGEIL
jgi:PhnB protein